MSSKSAANEAFDKKVKRALKDAQKIAKECDGWTDFSNRIFGLGSVMSQLFPTEKERTQFSKTAEHAEIMELFDQFNGPSFEDCSGNFMLRIPRSLHRALREEANVEGVSLNQLCLAKLSMQLRSLVNC